jgi:hypothetical protein
VQPLFDLLDAAGDQFADFGLRVRLHGDGGEPVAVVVQRPPHPVGRPDGRPGRPVRRAVQEQPAGQNQNDGDREQSGQVGDVRRS